MIFKHEFTRTNDLQDGGLLPRHQRRIYEEDERHPISNPVDEQEEERTTLQNKLRNLAMIMI